MTVRQSGPRYVARHESDPSKYERIPREILGKVQFVTTEEQDELETLAQVAIDGRLDGRTFSFFVRSFEQDTGREPSGAVKRLASRLKQWSEKGFPAPPETVASVLKWCAREGRQLRT